MDDEKKVRLDLSTIFINLLAIAFLSYVAWVLCAMHHYLKVVAVYALMMPKFISIWRAFNRTGKLTDLEQWIFAVIAILCWTAQSALTGKLSHFFR
jgi:hypothetical protein